MDNDESSILRSVSEIVDKLYTEFFGVFIPGAVEVGMLTLIVVAAFASIGVAFVLGCACALPDVSFPYEKLEEFAGFFASGLSFLGASSGMTVAVCVVFFCLSYLVGEVAYRRSPNKPDMQSILSKCFRDYELDNGGKERKDLVERDATDLKGMLDAIIDRYPWVAEWESLTDNCACSSLLCKKVSLLATVRNVRERLSLFDEFPHGVTDCINKNEYLFPYPCLRRYFRTRNLDGMARFVPWCEGFEAKPEEQGGEARKASNHHRTEAYCTKHQVNALKQAILNCRAAQGGRFAESINKTECHIKTLSAFWSVLRTCIWSVRASEMLLQIMIWAICGFFFFRVRGLVCSILLFILCCHICNIQFFASLPKKLKGLMLHKYSHPVFSLLCLSLLGFVVFVSSWHEIKRVDNGLTRTSQTNEVSEMLQSGEVNSIRNCAPQVVNIVQTAIRSGNEDGDKRMSSKECPKRSFFVRLIGSVVLSCLVVLFWEMRKILIIWRRRVVDIIHELRMRELVNVFGAVQIVADEFEHSREPDAGHQGHFRNMSSAPHVLYRFWDEGCKYEKEYCEHCKHWGGQCSSRIYQCNLKWPNENEN